METECIQITLEFHGLFQRKVKARFDGRNDHPRCEGSAVAGSGGADVTVGGLCGVFPGSPEPRLIEHTVKELLGHRVYGFCLG